MSNDHFFEEEEQFIISQDLLNILHCLLKFEESALSTLITKAYIKGFEEKLKKQDIYNQLQQSESVQTSIVQFFNFLEHHSTIINNQENNEKLLHKNIIKTIDQIDPKSLNYETIKSTVLATANKIKTNNHKKDAKSMFLKELLKQWDPPKDKNQKSKLLN